MRATLMTITTSTTTSGAMAAARTAPQVDHHQHLFSPAVVRLFASRSRNGVHAIAADDLVGMLDLAGIGRALVLSVAYLYGSPALELDDEYADVRGENDWTLAEVSRYPQRLRAFCSFNPLSAYALDELDRCAGDHHGLKLHLANSDVQLEDRAHVERLRRVFAKANEHRMPVVVHLRANIGKRRPYGERQARAFMDDVLPAAPDVPVQVAHLAGTGPGYDDPPADRALRPFIEALERDDSVARRLWFDVAALANDAMPRQEAELMAQRMRELGLGRVLFGSDAAIGNPAPREAWTAFKRLPLDDDELSTVAGTVAPYV